MAIAQHHCIRLPRIFRGESNSRLWPDRLRQVLMTGLATAAMVAGLGWTQNGIVPHACVPADSLPQPLLRLAPLGAEAYAKTWSATDQEVALGRRLFFDSRLSWNRSVACASCHRPEFAFGDDRRLSLGVGGQSTIFNTPSLINKGLSENLMWDGRAATLEEQVLMPIQSPREMGLGVERAVRFLSADPTYSVEFQLASGGPPNEARLASALAAFVRALVWGNSPVDRFRAGDLTVLTPFERAGLRLYEGRGGCWRCHTGPNFSDESFHNSGIGAFAGTPRPGRAAITGLDGDLGKFRTPGLRMLTKSAPYMHDGSLSTLEQVVDHYRRGAGPNTHLSKEMRNIKLSEQDARQLVAFLRTLSR